MTIYIGGVEFDCVTELDMAREARRTEVQYNTKGDMLIDLVNRKYVLTVVFGLMTKDELNTLRTLTQEIFVTVKFPAPEGEIEEEFHVSDEPSPYVTQINGVDMYGGVKLVMRQK